MINTINQYKKSIKQDSVSSFLNQLQFDILGFGRFMEQTTRSIHDFFVDDYELIYYIRGKVRIQTNNSQFIVNAGEMVLLKPFTLYSADSISDENVYYYYIHFKVVPNSIHQVFYDIFTRKENLVILKSNEFVDMSNLFASILQSWRNEDLGVYVMIESTLKTLITYFMRCVIESDELTVPISVDQDIDLFFEAIQTIDENISENIKLNNLALNLGVSTSALYKLFIKYLKLSPSEYIQKTRLFKTKQLLCISGTKIDDIVELCGFSSVSHLSKVFTKEYGFTPSAFQKYVREKEVWNDASESPLKLIP